MPFYVNVTEKVLVSFEHIHCIHLFFREATRCTKNISFITNFFTKNHTLFHQRRIQRFTKFN
jgi:hypothetical protein